MNRYLSLGYVVLGYQFCWGIIAWGVLKGLTTVSLSVVLLYLLGYIRIALHKSQALKVMALVTGIGFLVDGILIHYNLISIQGDSFFPLWLVAIWAAFSTLLNSALHGLKGFPFLQFFLGGLGGLFAYLSAHSLGVLTFMDMHVAVLVITITWAILIPVLYRLLASLNIDKPQIKGDGQ